MCKITIIGNSGSGKSTLALKLGRIHDLPVHHLDLLVSKGEWSLVPEAEFNMTHQALLKEPKWIIEGMGYESTFDNRFSQSDLIIFIDFNILVHIWWVIKRSMLALFQAQAGWRGRRLLITKLPKMLIFVLRTHNNTRAMIQHRLSNYVSQKVIRLANPKALNDFSLDKI
ncbi:hypothetical protein [Pseudoalteromonas umbrosa]|uniref:hypothetical protein n=1 Tax=Pseudoalteromonas umbrosa TaxID=3048489 RepID=UPI0024C2B512|nr:hypothetical protein [Pseudoalteromonas sp. B95]MDK1288860.1 hypothetical protein [Pseudoalteromonas sp. B95]